MFGSQITLFKLLGFDIKVDLSWLFLALLITWTLTTGFFPALYEGYSSGIYFRMGIAGALGLFASIILHELAHSIIARRNGIPIRSITLFIFGGVAEMSSEPPNAKAEFRMAIAGPLASFAVALLFHWLHGAGMNLGFAKPVLGVFYYMFLVNGLLALFNLIPAYPLDGGRVLRSYLWARKNDINWATERASRVGSGFGLGLIAVGVLTIIQGNFIGGMWWVLVGMFLRQAASDSYVQILAKHTFGGQPVSRFMTANPETVSPLISIQSLIDDHIYRSHHQYYPVIEDGKPIGLTGPREARTVPPAARSSTRVRHIMQPLGKNSTIHPDFEAMEALSLMNRTSNNRLLVIDNGQLVGILTLKDMLGFLSVHLDLEKPGDQ